MLRRLSIALVLVVSAWAGGAVVLDRYGATRDARGRVDAIVVAGCAVRANNAPSDALARRVRLAVELRRRGLSRTLVFTGGRGGGTISEAEASARLAETLGVPRADMRLEDRSRSTYQNAKFARALTNAQRVLIVTDGFHVLRSERIFGRYFASVRGVGTTSPRLRTRWWGALREVPLLVGDLFAPD